MENKIHSPFVTKAELCELMPGISKRQLDRLLAYRDVNGLREFGAVRKLTQKLILIHMERFLKWIDSNPY